MIGLTYIRENSNMTMEQLGKLLGVTKTIISKWESGVRKIPDKQLINIECMFGIAKTLIIKDIDEIDKIRIKKHIVRNEVKMYFNLSPEVISEIENSINDLTVNSTQNAIEQQKRYIISSVEGNYSEYSQFYKILKHPKGSTVINILLAAAEEYLNIIGFRSNAKKSDYKHGLIIKDDKNITNIVNVINLTLRKRKKNR